MLLPCVLYSQLIERVQRDQAEQREMSSEHYFLFLLVFLFLLLVFVTVLYSQLILLCIHS